MARPVAQQLDLGSRMSMRLRHTARLGKEVRRFGAEQRMWWLVPAVTIMMMFALAVTTTTTAVPVAVYTLF